MIGPPSLPVCDPPLDSLRTTHSSAGESRDFSVGPELGHSQLSAGLLCLPGKDFIIEQEKLGWRGACLLWNFHRGSFMSRMYYKSFIENYFPFLELIICGRVGENLGTHLESFP